MSPRRLVPALVVLLSLACSPSPAGEKAPPVRTDRHGDPLPERALVRLGCARLRVDEEVKALAFWPNDQTLAACCADGSVQLWDRATGRRKPRLDTGLGWVEFAAFIPGGSSILLRGGVKNQLLLWDSATGKAVWKQTMTDVMIHRLAGSPDGKLFGIYDDCREQAHVHEVSSGRKLCSLSEKDRRMEALAFSVDGSLLAGALAGGRDKSPRVGLWDVRTGKKVRDVTILKDAHVCALAFAPDGKTVAAASESHVTLSDVATGKQRIDFGFPRASVPYDLTEDALLFSTNGKTLFSGHYPGAAGFWDPATGKERLFRKTHASQWTRLALSRDGKALATADGDGCFRLLNLLNSSTGADLLPVPEGHHLKVRFVAFTPDGRALLSGDTETVQAWDTATGKPERSLRQLSGSSWSLSRDRRLLAALEINDIHLWDLAAGKKLRDLKYEGKDAIRAVAFSPDGRQLLSLHNRCSLIQEGRKSEGQDGLRVWDVATGKEAESFTASTPDEELYDGLVVTPDGNMAIAGIVKGWVRRQPMTLEAETEARGGGRLERWDLRTGRSLPPLQGHEGAIRALGLSADGKQLVSASADHTCRLWELASGKTIFRLTVPKSSEQTAAISPDGRLLASCSGREDSSTADPFTIRVYSTITGELVLELPGPTSCVCCLAFSPDGRRLASGFQDGTAIIWDVAAAQQVVHDEIRQLAKKEVNALWADLASADAARARQAVWALADKGDIAVRLLKENLQPAKGPGSNRLHKLVADLEDDDFAVREAASRELLQLGELAELALIEALKGQPSSELRRRARQLLAHSSTKRLEAPQLRTVRAVEVLERVGNAEARQVLGRLAAGAAGARQTREAKAALERLDRRHAP